MIVGITPTIAAELGDLTRFENPGKLMAFIGLIPSEHSSGERVKKGAITKTGNSHVRKALVEAAHAYRFPARKSRAIRKRQEELPKDVLDISWKAQYRLCTRYQYLTAKGKKQMSQKRLSPERLQVFPGQLPRLSLKPHNFERR